jgi:hypothetical protein
LSGCYSPSIKRVLLAGVSDEGSGQLLGETSGVHLAVEAETISAAANVATAIIALFAGVFAGYQVLLAARERRQRDRPFVVVDLAEGARGNSIDLVVANVGLTVARNVQLGFTERHRPRKRGCLH